MMANLIVVSTSKNLLRLILLLTSIFPFSSNCSGADISVSATISSQTFTTQQPAQLKILVEGAQRVTVAPPEVAGLIFHERGKSSQFSVSNGDISSSVTFTFIVQGLTPGKYTIPGFTVTITNKTLKTNSITCEVFNPSSTRPGSNASTAADSPADRGSHPEGAFIQFTIEKSEVYVGETVPATVIAYFDRSAKVNLTSLPQLSGSTVLADPFSNTPEQQGVEIAGVAYRAVTWHTFLTAIKQGTHTLGIALDATMLVPRRSRGSNFFEDDSFSAFFSQYESRPISLTSPLVTLSARPLPEKDKPAGFNGAIGTFSLATAAAPRTIKQGDPVTLSISISGSGNFTSVSPPGLLAEEGLKIYSPQITFTPDQNPHHGTKKFAQALVVTDPSISQIPPVVFSYFNPKTNSYQTLMSEPIPIEQQPVAPQPAPVHQNNDGLATRSVPATEPVATARFYPVSGAPLKLHSGKTVAAILPPFRQPLFLATLGGLCTLFLLITTLRLRAWYLNHRPLQLRQAQIKKKKRQLIDFFETIDHKANQDTCASAKQRLQTFLGFIWQRQPQSITTADVRARLGNNAAITELFRHADRQLYTNEHGSTKHCSKLTEHIISCIKAL